MRRGVPPPAPAAAVRASTAVVERILAETGSCQRVSCSGVALARCDVGGSRVVRAAGANGARLVDTMDELTEHVMTTDGTLQARVAARVADVAVAHGTSLLHARECVQLHSAHVRCVMRQLSCARAREDKRSIL